MSRRFKFLISGVAVVVFSVFVTGEAKANYSSYCGNSTAYWNAGGFAYKAVYQYSGTPSGGQQQKIYDIYKASQMTGWVKIVNDESHTCPYS